jgi:hypothetical protein
VVVDPGVDITFGSVIVVTPYATLRDVTYWVSRDLEADTFSIKLSAPLRRSTPFGWFVVESGLLPSEPATD